MSTCYERGGAPRRQRGEMLLEALVAVLITSLIGAGLAHVQSRVMDAQRSTKVERLVVGQLREQMQSNGTALCTADSVQLSLSSELTRDASVSCGAVQSLDVVIGGASQAVDAPREVGLSVSAADLELGDALPAEGAVDLLVSSHQ